VTSRGLSIIHQRLQDDSEHGRTCEFSITKFPIRKQWLSALFGSAGRGDVVRGFLERSCSFLLIPLFLVGVLTMPKGKVLHHQRVIGRIFRAAEAAKFPVDAVEFAPDGTITVRTRVAMPSVAKPEPNDFDNGDDQAQARQ